MNSFGSSRGEMKIFPLVYGPAFKSICLFAENGTSYFPPSAPLAGRSTLRDPSLAPGEALLVLAGSVFVEKTRWLEGRQANRLDVLPCREEESPATAPEFARAVRRLARTVKSAVQRSRSAVSAERGRVFGRQKSGREEFARVGEGREEGLPKKPGT